MIASAVPTVERLGTVAWRQLQFSAGSYFFGFRTGDIDPFVAEFVARLDPVDGAGRDRDALREGQDGIAHLRSGVRGGFFAQRYLQTDFKPGRFIRELVARAHRYFGIEAQHAAASRLGQGGLRFFVPHIQSFFDAPGFIPGVREQRRLLGPRGAIGWHRQERDWRNPRGL